MNVFIVVWVHEGNMGVFSTKEAAEMWLEKNVIKREKMLCKIEEWEIDGEYKE